ncbi:type III pantothenate kinase [Thiovibrio frasassiensis]|uniref:Type III pantothenate kinase n=1 Tax=Thiovibrio frasassiensis TaxID=2984131 RepID=A0A9X4MJP1_9BACT|nr:type III pantothenate kinase [Thiovibrio frasassiensis]MDG4476104.1 type III pantothenate kinase [Thiovibrio frasassiensis]
MLLAVDIGNTHMVIGVFSGPSLRCHWRVKTDKGSTVDELAAIFHTLFTMEGLQFNDISDTIISSVVPSMQAAWAAFATRYLHTAPLVVGGDTVLTTMQVLIDNPAEIGADRLVNAVAAYDRFKCPLIVVDFGTAITWDCVSGAGEYLGGAIAPGLSIAMEALGSRTAKLPQVDISTAPDAPIGTNTVAAIKSGILFGYGGMVDGLIRRLREQMAPELPQTVATGGMAALIAPYTTSLDHVDPMLTLNGLRLLHERNT